MKDRAVGRLPGLVALLLPLGVYLLTLAREITLTDSGELATAAATLGIAHPPGYPLFVLVGHLFSWLPLGSVAFRVGLVSACASAATSLLIYHIGRKLLDDLAPGLPARWAPVAGALLFAFARTPWSQAVVVEVYALQALLVIAFLGACLLALRPGPAGARSLPLVGFCLGLALTNHLTSVLLLGSLLVLMVLLWRARRGGSSAPPLPIWWTLCAFVLPLVLYIYLPVRSRLEPALDWGYPDNLHRFVVHVTGRQYHGWLGNDTAPLAELKRFITGQLPSEATWLFVILILFGVVVLWRRCRRFALVSLTAFMTMAFYNSMYPVHDIGLFYVPGIAICGIWAAIGAGHLVRLAGDRHLVAGRFLAVLLCGWCLLPLTSHWRSNDQHDFQLIAHYVRDGLRHVDPDAFVFTGRYDSFAAPLLYYQNVQGYRPDVVVVDVATLASPNLQKTLSVKAPDLLAAYRREVEAMENIGRRAERGQSIDAAEAKRQYRDFRRGLVQKAVDLRPTYITSDLFREPMFAGLNLISEGLVARVVRVDEFRPMTPEFSGPGLGWMEAREERERDILSDYAIMLRNRAAYLRLHGKEAEAAKLVGQAARLRR